MTGGKAVFHKAGDETSERILPAQTFIDSKTFQKIPGTASAAGQILIGIEHAECRLDIIFII